MKTHRCIGIFGGTFDPIHFGHLRSALEIYEQFQCEEMRFVPSRQPPHRTPFASPKHRLAMLRLSLVNTPFILDTGEMDREGPSYSIDTLRALRATYKNASLCLIIGQDAFLGLPTWHQWEKLIQLSNIIVMHRSGWIIPETGVIPGFLKEHALKPNESLQNFSSGKILNQKITGLDISGSEIRNRIQKGLSPQFLLPETVWEYIKKQKLYDYLDKNAEIQPMGKILL